MGKKEESKSCLKGFTQRVSADCLQLPSAPRVVSLATVFPNLSTASLPRSAITTHSIDASLECVGLFPGEGWGHLRSCSAWRDYTVSQYMCPSGLAENTFVSVWQPQRHIWKTPSAVPLKIRLCLPPFSLRALKISLQSFLKCVTHWAQGFSDAS